jgi:predicted nucleic acid-binding Zn ribbon protein
VKRRDDPVSMREAIAAVGRDLGLAAPDVLATITARWADIVGPAVAAHAQVRSVRDGECTIVVDGPAFATQLRYGSSDLVARVNDRCGEGSVTSIKVVVSGSRNA